MAGKLIFVSGLSGAGKTTLVSAALTALPQLTYLRTYTTRPMRPGEEQSHEYHFVTDKQYNALRVASTHWDHTAYNGYSYGADSANIQKLLARGKHIICAVAPDLAVVNEMAAMYGAKPLTIWINTPTDVALQRTADDELRAAREEDATAAEHFTIIFQPTGKVEADIRAFAELLKPVITPD